MDKYKLSKSTFLRGLQCEKSLFLYKHHYDLKDEISAQQQAIFDQGTEIGLLAQKLFPVGVDASPSSHYEMQESVQKTKSFLEAGEARIYEATFQYNGVLAALDILVKDEDGWKGYEVKSSTSVKEVNIHDAAIQYFTIVNSGIDLVDISIVHINNQYVKQGPIDIHQLFTIESVFGRVIALQGGIPEKIKRFKQVIEGDMAPNIDIGPHCDDPYSCDFKGYCWNHVPDYSIFNIANLRVNRKFELYDQGILTLEEVNLTEVSFSAHQHLQVESEQNGLSHIDHIKIKDFVSNLSYPLYHLDFETMSFAVPVYDHSRPYQQVPFQYSLHIEQEDGIIEHREFLAEADQDKDPRIPFVEKLIDDLGTKGDILVYNQGFEEGKLKDLQRAFPQYEKEINAVRKRLKDLMIPFKNKWYYTPEMKGSYSIKYVLPALVPELSYDELEIREGGSASIIFSQMVSGIFNGDIQNIREALKEYCMMDTWGMVNILNELKKLL
ncbi:protein of unknown function [Muriicola jejuensis]|uniref:DUF2779 domain-containing protein n=1 Tax=Muriicola jejuensis TaxID=504488 RepID=A0A6P0UAG4_9FLAO|nr:DUF2779 domain-containing protein [Muriicola jejuensis]NER10027.1 DUF2779 domain-containing protein [Muriicola jejuensis]SMP03640.1 protein of unknown function [Muriicola jejuensis]